MLGHSRKLTIWAFSIALVATSVAWAESNLDEDARFQVRAFLLASKTGIFNSLMPAPQFADQLPPDCQVSGTLDSEAFYLRIETLRPQSITAQLLWGTERSEPISVELSGEDSGVKIYSWFDGLLATSRIRVFLKPLRGGWAAVRVEAKPGWWRRAFSPLNAVCYFEDLESESEGESPTETPAAKSSELKPSVTKANKIDPELNY